MELSFGRAFCSHGELFRHEYRRSNRTKGIKILRCFPHCCPCHVERSYCGAPLELTARFNASTNEHLEVFARFELLKASPEIHSLEWLTEHSQSPEHPTAAWVHGVLSAPTGNYSKERTFVLNGEPGARWFYHWESGANKAHRSTRHTLRAYVFTRADDRWTLLRVVASPPFTVASYRRALHAVSPSPSDIDSASVALRYPMLPGQPIDARLHQLVQHQISHAFRAFCSADSPTKRPHHSSPPAAVHGEDFSEQYADVAILYLFISTADLHEALGSSKAREHVEQSLGFYWGCESCMAATLGTLCGHGDAVESMLTPLAPLLVELVIWWWAGESLEWWRECFAWLVDLDWQTAFERCVTAWWTRVDYFLRERLSRGGRLSEWSATCCVHRIRSAIVEVAKTDSRFQALRIPIDGILSSRRQGGWRAFVAQMRHVLITRTTPTAPTARTPHGRGPWDGEWRLLPKSVHTENGLHMNVWSACCVLAQFAQLELRVIPPAIYVRAKYCVVEGSWTLLVCDGRARITGAFPSGISTLAGQQLGGDYVGTVSARVDRFSVQIHWWPLSDSEMATRATVASTLSRDSRCIEATVTLERGVVHADRTQPIELWSPSARLAAVDEWQNVGAATATFTAGFR